jgi:predicted amidohydrolase
MKPETTQRDVNLAKMIGIVGSIMKERPKTNLIVFPELITSGYDCTKDEFTQLAELIPGGPSVTAMQDVCKKYAVHVVYGLPEQDPQLSGVLYNSAVFIDSRGVVLGGYRKAHPFGTEKQWCRQGSDLPVFETEFGKVGIMICWDAAFPEVARTFALKGADLLVVATNWEKPYSDDWDLLTKARAFDNTLHLVAANRIGDDRVLGFFGHSKIIDPVGKEIAALDEEKEGVIHAELDLSATARLRTDYYTIFKDRQPMIYGEITRVY